jgi:hypothetical protein
MERVRVDGNDLCFEVGGEPVSLNLGVARAEKWAKAITSPPPALAKKLGITAETMVRVLGPAEELELRSALEEAKGVSESAAESTDLILVRAESPNELAEALQQTSPQLRRGVPIWVVFPKGSAKTDRIGKKPGISEAEVRELVLPAGMVDTKVASVSDRLTAMRFIRRKG